MEPFARLQPTQMVPPLRMGTVGGPCWRLCDQKPKHFTLVLFYRGYHCRFCKEQLQEMESRYDDFHKLGVRVLAVSTDTRERAEQMVEEWGIDKLTVCYGLTLDQARQWGLYVSKGLGMNARGILEPDFFVEPAMFLVRPDGTLFSGIVQTMPVGRPRLEDLLRGLEYVINTGMEPRGTYDGTSAPAPRAVKEDCLCQAEDHSELRSSTA
jgi:peroxiredoxin